MPSFPTTRQQFIVPLAIAGVPLSVAAILPFGYLALAFVAGLAEIVGLRVGTGWGGLEPRSVGLFGLGAVVMATGIYLSATYWRALRSDSTSWPPRRYWWASAAINVGLFIFLSSLAVSELIRDPTPEPVSATYLGLWILWVGYVAAVSLYNAIYRPEAATAPEAVS
ncbi:MAG: hypothetical protein AAGJ11_16225 [Bacteroidota bacterium]